MGVGVEGEWGCLVGACSQQGCDRGGLCEGRGWEVRFFKVPCEKAGWASRSQPRARGPLRASEGTQLHGGAERVAGARGGCAHIPGC